MRDDEQKMEFTIKALAMSDPFATTTSMAADLKAALEWQAARSPVDVMKEREAIIVEHKAYLPLLVPSSSGAVNCPGITSWLCARCVCVCVMAMCDKTDTSRTWMRLPDNLKPDFILTPIWRLQRIQRLQGGKAIIVFPDSCSNQPDWHPDDATRIDVCCGMCVWTVFAFMAFTQQRF